MRDYPLNLIKTGLIKQLIPEYFVWAKKFTMTKVIQYVSKCIMFFLRDLSEINRGEGGGNFKFGFGNEVTHPCDGSEIF